MNSSSNLSTFVASIWSREAGASASIVAPLASKLAIYCPGACVLRPPAAVCIQPCNALIVPVPAWIGASRKRQAAMQPGRLPSRDTGQKGPLTAC